MLFEEYYNVLENAKLSGAKGFIDYIPEMIPNDKQLSDDLGNLLDRMTITDYLYY